MTALIFVLFMGLSVFIYMTTGDWGESIGVVVILLIAFVVVVKVCVAVSMLIWGCPIGHYADWSALAGSPWAIP